jgi:hypothetical protein
VVVYHQNADFVQALNLHHEKLYRSFCYLGPLRTKTERLYSWTGMEPESVGYAGENTVAAILAARNRKISLFKPGAKRASPAKPFEEIIALKLKEMGLIEAFKVNPISEQRQEYELKVRTTGATGPDSKPVSREQEQSGFSPCSLRPGRGRARIRYNRCR